MDRLPGVGMPVPDGAVGAAPFVIGEQLREGLRHGRPGAIFLVPAIRRAKGRVDLRVVRGIEMETAVPRGRMHDDTVRIEGRALRRAPRRIRAGANLSPAEHGPLALMLGILMHTR